MPTANIEYIKLRGGGEGDLMRKTKTKFGKKFKKIFSLLRVNYGG